MTAAMADDAHVSLSLSHLQPPAEPTEKEAAAGIVPSHGISINLLSPASAADEGSHNHNFRHPVRHV